MDFSDIELDTNLVEDGAPLVIDGQTTLLICYTQSNRYLTALTEVTERYQSQLSLDVLPPEINREAMIEVAARAVWVGHVDGKPLYVSGQPFDDSTWERRLELLKNPAAGGLLRLFRMEADKISNFRRGRAQGNAGNLRTASGTRSHGEEPADASS